MKPRMGVLVVAGGAALLAQTVLGAAPVKDWRRTVEHDWLVQAGTLTASHRESNVDTRADAAGGCDGVKDGKWGFHTSHTDNPWWQVDLEQAQTISRVVIWNRCDDVAGRNAHITVLLSDEGQQWRKAYTHDGGVFYGYTDQKPLEIKLEGQSARFVRVQIAGKEYLHLDEVEVFGLADAKKNLALGRPANQISTSEWSKNHMKVAEPDWHRLTRQSLETIEKTLMHLGQAHVETAGLFERFNRLKEQYSALGQAKAGREFYVQARSLQRDAAFANPLLNFNRMLFVQRVPGQYSHMSDQFYGWWSRPGGGVFVLEDWKTETPRLTSLTSPLPPGSVVRPDISYDARKVLFAYCKHYPGLAGEQNKTDKAHVPEDAFYHIFEINADGSGMRQITHGKYDDFDARYLPSGEIVFLSTRRGQAVQTSRQTTGLTRQQEDLPNSYVRCGGGDSRPVAVYTLHVMEADGSNLRPISSFENFEWTPSIAADGRVIYARWDYVDRHNQPFMSLWSTNPDGTNPQLVYKNYTVNPLSVFEARQVPGSRKFMFTASAHHSISGGSIALLDIDKGNEEVSPLTRLTPEVCFPESEGWPNTWYCSPYPLSEDGFLAAWSHLPLRHEGQQNEPEGLGVYWCDAAGNHELIYRDPKISSLDPMPLRPRTRPLAISASVAWNGPQEGRFLVLDVYAGLTHVQRGAVKGLRIIGVPAKTQPQMNSPNIGLTAEDPGKCVLGTVPVEADGSAHFRAPSGVPVFFQALDAEGKAIQTMRTLTYVQPGQTLSCVGCHEHRYTAPANTTTLAAAREASKLTVGPEGSWPFNFDRLVQPVLDQYCVRCHKPDGAVAGASRLNLTAPAAYETLLSWGQPSLRDQLKALYMKGRSVPGQMAAQNSPLLASLEKGRGHADLKLDARGKERLITWLDTYAQRMGHFSEAQERELVQLRAAMAGMLLETAERK